MACGAQPKLACLLVVCCGFLLCSSVSLEESSAHGTTRSIHLMSEVLLQKRLTVDANSAQAGSTSGSLTTGSSLETTTSDENLAGTGTENQATTADDDAGNNNNDNNNPVIDDSWFSFPEEKKEEVCDDFCPMFSNLCPKGEVCVTNEECKMVCRKSGGSPLETTTSDENLTGTDTENQATAADNDDGNKNDDNNNPVIDDSWFSFPEEKKEEVCDDFCPMFPHLCRADELCVTNEECKMVCRKPGVPDVPLRTPPPTTKKPLRPLRERQCNSSDKECVYGTCTDGQTCTCDAGYEGDTCADKECHVPCRNGVCRRLHNGHFKCVCDPGWQDAYCHIPECTLPCVNGSCMWRVSPNSTMFCSCKDPYIGELCDKKKPTLKESSTALPLIVGIATPIVCLLALVISWYILWRKRVIFVFKLINMFKAYEDDDDKIYDAYVSLTDADYVFMKHVLQPKLEEMGHRVYLHARDSIAGDVKSEKILEAIEKSRRCIMLLSADYISNEWCRFEYLIAQHETCIKLKQRIIPIMLDDIDKDKKKMDKTLRFIVDSVKCLRYPCPPSELSDGQCSFTGDPECAHPKSKELVTFERRQARFWERLRLSMPKKREVCEVTSPTLSCTSECPLSHHAHYNKKGVRLFLDKCANIFPFGESGHKSSTTNFIIPSSPITPSGLITPVPPSEKRERKLGVAMVNTSQLTDPNLDAFYNIILKNNLSTKSAENTPEYRDVQNKPSGPVGTTLLKLEIHS
ncbi:protein toll [Plakobranchus ocellatus]|uniref:Protein toll n=1 Tax=Plakobranchus ocellatus TaxID=259542 RepID=A0AAV4CZG6_9GAST|nr:protein toll [Plakobranchus ocellatus]